MKNLVNLQTAFLGFLTILYLKLELFLTLNGLFAYTYDQGRDLLEAAKIAFEKNIPFIGPTTGLPGIFYGPWWYYLLAAPIFISGGNPTVVAILFSLFSLATAVATYFFLRSLTRSFLISSFFSYISLVSSFWMLSPSFIWSPTLVPILMILLFHSFLKILSTHHTIYFFLYGLASQAILNGEVAFGVMVTLWQFLTIAIFRKDLLNKKLIFMFLGMLVLWLPQVLFEIKNNFLETKAVIAYLNEPKIYGVETGILNRLVQRLDSILDLVSKTFFQDNNIIAFIFVIFLAASIKAIWKTLSKNKQLRNFTICIIWFLTFSVAFFTIFQDRVWDYYLIGIPITVLLLTALVSYFLLKIERTRYLASLLLVVIFAFNLPLGIFDRFKEEKVTDGGAYLNAKRVMDYIASDNPNDYSLYVFSPAIFDPPFDYLVYWYNRRGLITKPQEAKRDFYLVIREYSTNKYLNTGWYGDKTRDRSNLLVKKEFIGDIVVEKHQMP